MKHPNITLSLILLTLTSYLSCTGSRNHAPFTVTTDTIHIQLRDSMHPASRVTLTHAVKHKDHYYTLFNETELYSYSYDKIHFYIISNNGNIRSVPFPNKIIGSYFDLFVKNDSVIFKDYMDGDNYYLDHTSMQWITIPEADDVVFEDQHYYITSRDFGEWGYLTWFRNKFTGQEYELGTFATHINKVDSSYYITDAYRILRIDDPTQLKPTTPERFYTYIKNGQRLLESYTQLQGAEILYQDTTYKYPEWEWDWETETQAPPVAIITSFVHNNELFQLCLDSVSMYVARLNGHSLLPVQYIDEPKAIFNWHNSYRMSIQDNGSQLLKFDTEDPNLFGFIGIHGNQIDIRYLRHDIDSIPYLGKEAFPAIFSHLHNHPGSPHLNTMCRIEEESGATNLQSTENWGLYEGYYPNPHGYDINRDEKFIRTQDANLSCIASYYYTKKDSIVRAARLTWTATKPYKRQKGFYIHPDNPDRLQLFQNKVNELTQYLTTTLHKQPTIETKKAYHTFHTLLWVSDQGMKVNLHYSDDFITGQEISVVMYY